MTDPKKIEISGIKDLELIQFYDITEIADRNSRIPLMGLKILYDTNKTLSYDYRDIYFEDFVSKVIKTYHSEKKKKNILVMNDVTEHILGNSVMPNTDRVASLSKYDNLTDVSMIRPREAKMILLKDYIIETLLSIIRVFSLSSDIKPIEIKGVKDRFVFCYERNGETKLIPLSLVSVDYTKFKLIANAIEGHMIKFTVDIRLGSNSVRIKWSNKDKSLCGEIEYNIEHNVTKRTNFIDGKQVWLNEEKNSMTDEHSSLLRFYTDLGNMPVQTNLMKTVGLNTLCYDAKITPYGEDSKEIESEHLHSRIGRTIMNFRHNSKYGSLNYNDMFLITHDEIKQNVSFILLDEFQEFDYVLIQRQFVDSFDASGKFKTQYAGKNYYEVLKIKKGTLLNQEFDILDRYVIDDPIKTEDDIIKTMIKRGDNYGKL